MIRCNVLNTTTRPLLSPYKISVCILNTSNPYEKSLRARPTKLLRRLVKAYHCLIASSRSLRVIARLIPVSTFLDPYLAKYSIGADKRSIASTRRKALQDFEFSDGLTIEKGKWVCTPAAAMMRDPKSWVDSQEFMVSDMLTPIPSNLWSDLASSGARSQKRHQSSQTHARGRLGVLVAIHGYLTPFSSHRLRKFLPARQSRSLFRRSGDEIDSSPYRH